MSDSELQSISYRINQWLYTHPDAVKIPHHIEVLMRAELKHIQAQRNKAPTPTPRRLDIKDELEEHLIPYSERKQAELQLADYIEQIDSIEKYELKFQAIVEKMRACRCNGAVGRTRDGDLVHVWDEKCSCSKLCPHESRDETRRLINRYMPAIEGFVNEKAAHRAFFSVFSFRNYGQGLLGEGKKDIIERFKKWSKKFPEIKGSLVVQEDPLSVHGNWNVHINVVLLVEGAFSYQEARQAWGNEYQLFFKLINPANLVKTLCEVIKYSAQIVPSKSQEKAQGNVTRAPAMTEWPHERFIEWYKANKGFRRTRTYGVLYGIKDGETEKDLTDIHWEGEINFSHDGRYMVSLIQGDNFGRRYQRIGDLFDQDQQRSYYENSKGPP